MEETFNFYGLDRHYIKVVLRELLLEIELLEIRIESLIQEYKSKRDEIDFSEAYDEIRSKLEKYMYHSKFWDKLLYEIFSDLIQGKRSPNALLIK